MTTSLSAMDYFSAKLAYEITPEDLVSVLATDASPTVVDTRPVAAWRHGWIPGALQVPSDDLVERHSSLLPDEDADIVVYAWGGDDRSATRTALRLLQLGYTQVRELVGGYYAWEDAGFPVESDAGQAHHRVTPIAAPRAG